MPIILLIHGPNLNKLGERAAAHYGVLTLADLETKVTEDAKRFSLEIKSFQSNHEGALIDFIQAESKSAVGIIINPGALTHYSYSLHDALVDAGLPTVEVHLSDIKSREEWRQISVTAPACIGQISGKGVAGYADALKLLAERLAVD
ncbi:MAG: 3-dehydroquinate dehydratase [Candidatus Magasanikbacteria bacterium RIFOXYD2_FULL_41_14]|uniref:3-dehydroquinate dehydratase n=1 Tax=Candidatus Magasanikbacteria bacterium RIFOXYD2_FULL_41_14 TaxID=1798709 RepID=A0A1F6PD54_9BACT|nr:MAG: 3-dehydroquinate dehydratase [Candidatus Magasanikbacteria bacterium RIFOXYD2_FULL_41_14]